VGLAKIATWFRRPSLYKARHFRRREEMRADYQRVAKSLLEHLDFDSVADVGCANGFLLEEFLAAGKRIAGIELSPAVVEVLADSIKPHVSIGDFSELVGDYELACCVEVAEHIPPDRSEDLVAALTSLTQRWIYFTAAPPGQSGRGHINCRPHEEWLGFFAARGWVRDDDRTAELRDDLDALQRAHWLQGTSFVLVPAEDADAPQ
jgi:SAM-dependent methyltransferase